MPAVFGALPAHERLGIIREPVDSLADLPQPGPVDPPAEIGRGRDVRADRHDVSCDVLGFVCQIDEEPPERLLCGRATRVGPTEIARHARRRRELYGLAPETPCCRLAQLPCRGPGLEHRPRVCGV